MCVCVSQSIRAPVFMSYEVSQGSQWSCGAGGSGGVGEWGQGQHSMLFVVLPNSINVSADVVC